MANPTFIQEIEAAAKAWSKTADARSVNIPNRDRNTAENIKRTLNANQYSTIPSNIQKFMWKYPGLFKEYDFSTDNIVPKNPPAQGVAPTSEDAAAKVYQEYRRNQEAKANMMSDLTPEKAAEFSQYMQSRAPVSSLDFADQRNSPYTPMAAPDNVAPSATQGFNLNIPRPPVTPIGIQGWAKGVDAYGPSGAYSTGRNQVAASPPEPGYVAQKRAQEQSLWDRFKAQTAKRPINPHDNLYTER